MKEVKDKDKRIEDLELALRRLIESSTSLQGVSEHLLMWAQGVLGGIAWALVFWLVAGLVMR